MPELKNTSSRCLCTGCGEFFKSVTGFDMHRVTAVVDEIGDETRRCLTPAEMVAKGMSKNPEGIWITKAWDRPEETLT